MATYQFSLTRTVSDTPSLFTLDLDSRMTVLDALFIIQRAFDHSLAFRCSCRVGMCGTCAVRVNRIPQLACQTRVETLGTQTITIEPLSNLPVVKDLVVDLSPFFRKWKKVRPAFSPKNNYSKELAIVQPDSEFGQQARLKGDCITCGACYTVCGIAATNEAYLGPAAINRAMLRLYDPRDGNIKERLRVLNDEAGVWRCHTQFNCVASCPKSINLTDSIMNLKRALLFPSKFYNKQ